MKVRVICGRVGDKQGPVRDIIIDPEYIDVTIPPQTEFAHLTKRGHTVFAYVIEGQGYFYGDKKQSVDEGEGLKTPGSEKASYIGNETLVLFDDGDQIMVSTGEQAVRFLLISGKPIGEPVAWQGPIVMNTQEELRTAFEEYQKGTFIR